MPAPGVAIRQVQGQELEPALRLILAGAAGRCSDDVLLDFLHYAVERRIDLYQTRVIVEGQQLHWAVLPIVSPGRTALLLCPAKPPAAARHAMAAELVDDACAYAAAEGCQLGQVLLDPHATGVEALLQRANFRTLTRLVYLRLPKTRPMMPLLPAGLTLASYTPARHAQFIDAIARSYTNSLDCPELNGLRTMEDVIDSHKSAGAFEPQRWRLLLEGERPLGVALTAAIADGRSSELVYLGIAPEARGRGLGEVLLRVAINDAYEAKQSSMTLAVDSRNVPALRLYWRHGFVRAYERTAMLRDLHGR